MPEKKGYRSFKANITLTETQCDRVKPCQACCAHGHPSKCVYDLTLSDEDFHPISQSDEIRNLRVELKGLRDKLQRRGRSRKSTDRPNPIWLTDRFFFSGHCRIYPRHTETGGARKAIQSYPLRSTPRRRGSHMADPLPQRSWETPVVAGCSARGSR